MSAEVLREAARLMRERAEAAIQGPYVGRGVATCWSYGWTEDQYGQCYGVEIAAPGRPHFLSGAARGVEGVARAEAEATAAHVASWPPAVALAVADWLDAVAERQKPTDRWGRRSHGWTGAAQANAVARAYLGDPS